MSDYIARAAQSRMQEIDERLVRFKLVFVQCGAMFAPLRNPILSQLGGAVLSATEFAAGEVSVDSLEKYVVISDVEKFALTGKSGGSTLGALRSRVNSLLLADVKVCLVSRFPRTAFAPVAGSNLLDDASPHCIPLLDFAECPELMRGHQWSVFPALGLERGVDIDTVQQTAIEELGINVLAELDFALFEAQHQREFVSELEPVIAEAMRGAGFANIIDGQIKFVSPTTLWQFRDSVAHVIGDLVTPQGDLAATSDGLWQIERTIRKALRHAVVVKHGKKWRKQLFSEQALIERVLERARSDVNVTAASLTELRDPTEWLTLGELLGLVRSAMYGGLFWNNATWKRFEQDVLPIRNRLSHMRLLKRGDKATVRMWVNRLPVI